MSSVPYLHVSTGGTGLLKFPWLLSLLSLFLLFPPPGLPKKCLSVAYLVICNSSCRFFARTQISLYELYIRFLLNRGGEGCHPFLTCVYRRNWSSLSRCLCPYHPLALGVWEERGSRTWYEPRRTGRRCAFSCTYLWYTT